ncbi:microtubule-associated protein 4 [Diplodia corticola]|uniref:Microtubule-associated protein 4 n=1 Tax=Diplodia corticola TaxID=236234 RepID=A0A1J9R9W7_9PEZI|nr:microtubule-associated protein 4 [Diplodia corticola]OJD29227.1 microtubule-associated protein 4 [Diplodia corticola]
MAPPPAVADALCCNANTDSRPNSPQPFRRHLQHVKPGGDRTTQRQPLEHQAPSSSHNTDDLTELQQIFAEAGSRPATAAERTFDDDQNDDKPKKNTLLKRLTRELSRSNLSLSNLKKGAAAKEKAQKEQQPVSSGNKKVKSKKPKPKSKIAGDDVVEMDPSDTATREILLDRTYDSDAANLPDIKDSVGERLPKVTDPENGKGNGKISPIKNKRSSDRRGELSSIDWAGKSARDEPYGWGEPSSSAPALSVHIPRSLSDLGVLPSCNVSVESLPQLSQASGRSSPWKKFAEQHLRRRSKSADNLRPVTPDLKATELPSLTSSFNSKGWRLSADRSPALNLPLSEPRHTIHEDKNREETHDETKLNETRRFADKAPFASPPTTSSGTDTTDRTGSETLPDAEYGTLSLIPGNNRHVSVHGPHSNLPDPESVSVHLHNMRISEHLRSDSTLSGISRTPTAEAQQDQKPHRRSEAKDSVASGGEPCMPPTLHTQQSGGTVRQSRKLRCSSSGFASERVPDSWGNVVSATPSSVYEPSSVYSTRQNSLTSSSTCTPVASPKVNFSAAPHSGHGTIVRKSGYEVLNLDDLGPLRMESAEADEKGKASVKESPERFSTMPGAFPPSSSINLLKRADTGLTFRTANEKPEAIEKIPGPTEGKGKRPAYKLQDSSDQTTTDAGEDTLLKSNQQSSEETAVGEDVPLKQNQQSFEETTDSSLDITPVTAVESPMSSEKTPKAQPVSPAPAAQLSSAKHKKKPSSIKTPSMKTPSKRFSTFSFFRSKTYSNLRRASHSPALRPRKMSRSDEHLALDDSKDKAAKGARGFDHHTDGPSDLRTPKESHEHPPRREQHQSMMPEAVEEHRPGRLSRSWLIGDGRKSLGQDAMWEKALKKHRDEKNALFLSPEKGGKVEARGLYRERSGSGSALSTRSQLSDRKGKSPAFGGDFTFGGTGPGLQRSPTILLDPLETTGFGEGLMKQRPSSGMLGDELRLSTASGSVTPANGISPGASTGDDPSVVSIEKDVHIDSWGGTTLAEIEASDLGAWSRFPSHTRELRTGAAGSSDDVRTRDFAYETNMPRAENESSTEDEDPSMSGAIRLTKLRSMKRTKTDRSGMSKSKSMTFSRNFSFLKHYIGLFRSQSEEFRKYGHGHRSSVAESATLEHPELEILPPVFSPVQFEVPQSPQGAHTDGATSIADLTAVEGDAKATDEEAKAKESKVDFKIQRNRREESTTDSSDGSWAANARVFTRAYGNDADRGNRARLKKKGDSSAEWRSNARTWTRFSTPSQDFQQALDDAGQRCISSSSRLERQLGNLTEESTMSALEKVAIDRGPMATRRPPRAQHNSSEEWRSDARLFSQMYESCVQIPSFGGSSEDANASESSAQRPLLAHRHHKSSSASTAFRLASTGHLDDMVARAAADEREKVKFRRLSDGYGESADKKGEKTARNDSFLSIGSVEGTTRELTRYLHDLEEGEQIKLEAERMAGV